ncbi:MAG TPA: hypothetical protein VFJ57_16190 [Solirubrobacterales bacterium]|nr:hypothetical protein [Solirubrobacterales bacterium]
MSLTATGGAAPAGSTDLGITKTDSPDPVRVGSPLTYSIGVQNHGPLAASDVTVTDPLPKGVDLLSASASTGTCASKGRKVTCRIGSVPFGVTYSGAATVTIAVVPRQVGTITNTASVKAKEKDPVGANDTASATTRVLGVATCRGATATVTGTAGDDVLDGTGGPDVIVGFGGDDTIRSGPGRDLICAGSGEDLVVAGSAADRVFGGAGRDLLRGRGGPDLIKAGPGNDLLRGDRGSDRLRGGAGFDRCRGGAGHDLIRGCER